MAAESARNPYSPPAAVVVDAPEVVAGLHLIMIGLDLAVFYLLFFPGRYFFRPLPR